MTNIFVITEHREGRIREVTFELIRKAVKLGEEIGADISAVLLGHGVDKLAEELSFRKTDEVLVIEDKRLETYNCDGYKSVLLNLIEERKPILTMIPHTAYGMDFAPSLATKLDFPLVTDCLDLEFKNGEFTISRQMYGGKINIEIKIKKTEQYLTTVRPTSFEPVEEDKTHQGKIINVKSMLRDEDIHSKTLEFIQPPVEDVDITEADILVSVGRGIGSDEYIPVVEALAEALGGVISGSRPVIDMGWLSHGRQVGISGKTVKPKLYIAIGISGQIQHQMGMKESQIVIAINKDPNAPIFNIADYGIVDDLFDIIPLLTEQLKKK